MEWNIRGHESKGRKGEKKERWKMEKGKKLYFDEAVEWKWSDEASVGKSGAAGVYFGIFSWKVYIFVF